MSRIHLGTMIGALAVLTLAACADETDAPAESELSEHQALWESHALEDYQFAYEPTGFAANPNQVVTVTVVDGAVAAVESRDGTPLASSLPLTQYPTIDQLFEQIRVAEAGEGVTVVVEAAYDAVHGHPTHAQFEDTSETYGFEVGELVVIDASCLDDGATCSREQTLAASAARWLERDPGTSSAYCVERSYTSFTGAAWQSFTEVSDGAIGYWRLTTFDGFDDTLGETQEGTGPTNDARVARLNELYATCRDDLLTRPSDTHEVALELDDDGLLQSCYATELGCADDCTTGIVIDALTFEACARPSESQ